MVSALVTGTNQGIGFGIVQQLAKRADVDHVFATVRNPESDSVADLKKLASSSGKIHVIKLELNEESAKVFCFWGVILICRPPLVTSRKFWEIKGWISWSIILVLVRHRRIQMRRRSRNSEHRWKSIYMLHKFSRLHSFRSSAWEPRKYSLICITHLPYSWCSSTVVGSITLNDGRLPYRFPAYGASKAALNFLTSDWAKYLGKEGFTVVALSPGVNPYEMTLNNSTLKRDCRLVELRQWKKARLVLWMLFSIWRQRITRHLFRYWILEESWL